MSNLIDSRLILNQSLVQTYEISRCIWLPNGGLNSEFIRTSLFQQSNVPKKYHNGELEKILQYDNLLLVTLPNVIMSMIFFYQTIFLQCLLSYIPHEDHYVVNTKA